MGAACAWCDGNGDTCNPGNADPALAIEDWLPPTTCPRCRGTGWDPSEPHPSRGYERPKLRNVNAGEQA